MLTEVLGNRSTRRGGRRELAEQLLTRPERDPPMCTIVLHLGRIELEDVGAEAREDSPPYTCVIHLRRPQKASAVSPALHPDPLPN